MKKFTVSTRHTSPAEFAIVIMNRAGRAWESVAAYACPGEASEVAQSVQEYLNDDGKLTASAWRAIGVEK